MMTFNEVLKKYRDISLSERNKGDKFEELMQNYLRTDRRYANLFSDIWLWNEFPYRDQLGNNDTGIDLVAKEKDGGYWAIQCKCYAETTAISKAHVDTFLSTSSRTFIDNNNNKIAFAQRLWISTTNKWSSNAEDVLINQTAPVTRINLFDLQESAVDWEKLENGTHGEKSRTKSKSLRNHQKEALTCTHNYFKENDRGKLIMACGTGKTFTALRIAEHETDNNGLVLFLVPSIALLAQTLREWSADAQKDIYPICICSDPKVSKKKIKNSDNTTSTIDLGFPASTDSDVILKQFNTIKKIKEKDGLTVVFSTYQSIDVIANTQKVLMANGYPEFDMIICDEAHRTTGIKINNVDESAFIKVHDNSFIQSKKRIYMTATPRLYSDDSKSKAKLADAVLCSMDDPEIYGEDIYHIGFGDAVEKNLLTDYKVIILTLNEDNVPPAIQDAIANGSEINTDDATKLIGCITALSKQIIGDNNLTKTQDPGIMKRAVAFCRSVSDSKKIANAYNSLSDKYIDSLSEKHRKEIVNIEAEHMDGTMPAPERDEILGWLKEDTTNNTCRIITNVKVLSEGVDVPNLDSVMFLSPKNSQVDVVQSVGRVMRRSEGKNYGYIIIPVVIPSNLTPAEALNDNKRYKVVWSVLNALRAHDDRFNAIVNKIDLNRKKPEQIIAVQAPNYDWEKGELLEVCEDAPEYGTSELSKQLELGLTNMQSAIYAKLVNKVGDRRYWDDWAKSIAEIAEKHIDRITKLVSKNNEQKIAFNKFLDGLHKNINPSITKEQAIEMLAQHLITKPVFEALFEGYSFEKNNAVSNSMQNIIEKLEETSLGEEQEDLTKFYESVRKRAAGIDNAEGKQKVIVELYDKFFKVAFPKMVEQLGIVYTPIEVVDFIIHSVNDILISEFNRTISDENIHILDPFTGTGTFITRVIQSGLIRKEDLERKFKKEIHANEIVLLAYYIASVNIENAFYDVANKKEFTPFDGIVLTDTFQLGETDESKKLFSEIFPQNSKRVEAQKKAPLRIIIGNPPYSIGQKSAHDDAQNQSYKKLDSKIESTYGRLSTASLQKSLYDTYIKAFRWSTDRLDSENGGIIAFVSNGSWLDNRSSDGFRKSIEKEFSSIWVYNLRGNQRTSGETSKKEGGKIFGSGSRTPISITIMVKKPKDKETKATIYYKDIGDYLNTKDKLNIIKSNKSVNNINWDRVIPNEECDWIEQRNPIFNSFEYLVPQKKENSIFNTNMVGIGTNRDVWAYNFSVQTLNDNMSKFISFYNKQLNDGKKQLIDYNTLLKKLNDNTKIKWTRGLSDRFKKGESLKHRENSIIVGNYRPFCKQNFYNYRPLLESPGLLCNAFRRQEVENKVILISGIGSTKDFSVMIVNNYVDLNYLNAGTKCLPMYYYEEEKIERDLFNSDIKETTNFTKKDNISDYILTKARKKYNVETISKQDIFYYVYGYLNNTEYKNIFKKDLTVNFARIPLVESFVDFTEFKTAGINLANLHLNYENYSDNLGSLNINKSSNNYAVSKMKFKDKEKKDVIIYNSNIEISNIPSNAYKYVVNGKSAIEWIMDRYQVTKDKDSGIINNPNLWSKEYGDDKYIFSLLIRIINMSIKTVDIIESLPKIDFEN